MKNILSIATMMFFVVVISATAQDQKNAVKETLDVSAYKAKMEATPGAVVLDVRTPEEVKLGVIPGATNINYNGEEFKSNLDKLDKNKTYFVYCAKGGRSSLAADVMQEMGFTSVYNLEGGFNAWKEKGLPVKKK